VISIPLEKIVNTDGGIHRLLQAWGDELDRLRSDLESKALRNDRDAAVAAGRIDGFRRAIFGVIHSVHSEIILEGRDHPPAETTPDDDGY